MQRVPLTDTTTHCRSQGRQNGFGSDYEYVAAGEGVREVQVGGNRLEWRQCLTVYQHTFYIGKGFEVDELQILYFEALFMIDIQQVNALEAPPCT